MAVIRDVMPVFELYQPASIDDAIKLLDKHGADGLALAGGLDSMDWLKDRLKKPNAVIDLGTIKELKGVKELNGGIEIGAMTPLTEVVKHPLVREKFSLLMEAAELVASPQIRNQGTLGGLVEITHRFARVLNSALERQRLCSGDPVCADHAPVTADDDRMLHGAACHGRALVERPHVRCAATTSTALSWCGCWLRRMRRFLERSHDRSAARSGHTCT